jgi:hypothetical protein
MILWSELNRALHLLDQRKLIMSVIMSLSHTYSYIHHVISPLVHTWSWSYAYACNRCIEECDKGDVHQDVPRGAGTSLGVGGPVTRSRRRRGNHAWKLKPWAILFCERQAPEHYKPPTFKAINYICYMCIVALSGRSWLEPLAALYHSLSRYMNPWILCRQDRFYA